MAGKWFIYLQRHHSRVTTWLRKKYVCVEPGVARGFVKVQPGEFWIGGQTLSLYDHVYTVG
jgi:hypothetical protein